MKTVLITVIGNTGSEPEALRQSLEAFGYFVCVKYIGRPKDLIEVLSGALPFDPDHIILSCHGENGAIIMPVLAEEIYEMDEPKGNFTDSEISKHLKLSGKTILSLGCTTAGLAPVFGNSNAYIAPKGYVAGTSALMFAVRFFYEIIQNRKSIPDAFDIAAGMDEETGLFILV